jgi:plasmid stability protein
MATLIVRNLDDGVKERLRRRAAEHGRSMEAEVRAILRSAVAERPARAGALFRSIREKFEPLGGVELDIPARGLDREPPSFSE